MLLYRNWETMPILSSFVNTPKFSRLQVMLHLRAVATTFVERRAVATTFVKRRTLSQSNASIILPESLSSNTAKARKSPPLKTCNPKTRSHSCEPRNSKLARRLDVPLTGSTIKTQVCKQRIRWKPLARTGRTWFNPNVVGLEHLIGRRKL